MVTSIAVSLLFLNLYVQYMSTVPSSVISYESFEMLITSTFSDTYRVASESGRCLRSRNPAVNRPTQRRERMVMAVFSPYTLYPSSFYLSS